MNRIWLEFDDPELMGRACAAHIGRTARTVLEKRPAFTLALSGGRSPLPLFRALSNAGLFPSDMWQHTHIFFADERLVPPDHPDSNFASVRDALLQHIALPADNLHRMAGENEPVQAARDYARQLRSVCPQDPTGLPRLDLVMLGMGVDGHTASIFPGSPLPGGDALTAVIPPPQAQPPKARLTLTPLVLNCAREIIFLVQGRDKHQHLRDIRSRIADIPAARITASPQSWYISPPLPYAD